MYEIQNFSARDFITLSKEMQIKNTTPATAKLALWLLKNLRRRGKLI